mmetsp:Transcript_23040/g.22424  ORF Transcript_23040/g.22424 Transcript_23040/m.22424 type:complete len:128 (-) Transcript_23040:2585-2968(-)
MPFNKSVLVKVVPRYLIINQLGTPLVIKQKGKKSQVLIQKQEAFNFEQKTNKLIQVRSMMKEEQQVVEKGKALFPSEEETYWSPPFSIEDIDDFQLSFLSQVALSKEWYEPTIDNNYNRFVRVIVTT